jgi:hypothetical protein
MWYRQVRAADGKVSWKQNVILPAAPDLRRDAVRFSQLHALALQDMNGDGLPDIVTGKRFWAHGPLGDVEPDAPAVLYWFELQRQNGSVTFVPHLIDADSGVGTQVTVADWNGINDPTCWSPIKKACSYIQPSNSHGKNCNDRRGQPRIL